MVVLVKIDITMITITESTDQQQTDRSNLHSYMQPYIVVHKDTPFNLSLFLSQICIIVSQNCRSCS